MYQLERSDYCLTLSLLFQSANQRFQICCFHRKTIARVSRRECAAVAFRAQLGDRFLFISDNEEALYKILEFPHIARPGISQARLQKLCRDRQRLTSQTRRLIFHEVVNQNRNILPPIAQWASR